MVGSRSLVKSSEADGVGRSSPPEPKQPAWAEADVVGAEVHGGAEVEVDVDGDEVLGAEVHDGAEVDVDGAEPQAEVSPST